MIIELKSQEQHTRALRLVACTQDWEDNYTIDVAFPSRQSSMEFPIETEKTLAKWVKTGRIPGKQQYHLWEFSFHCHLCKTLGSFECEGHDQLAVPIFFHTALQYFADCALHDTHMKTIILEIDGLELRKCEHTSKDAPFTHYWEEEEHD